MKLRNKQLAKEWFDRAASDLQYAKAGDKETGQHHITCFLCHQAVEKILKSLIVGAGKTPQKTHSLRILLGQAVTLQPDIELSEADVRKLDAFYIPSHYPGPTAKNFTAQDAKQALAIAAQALQSVY